MEQTQIGKGITHLANGVSLRSVTLGGNEINKLSPPLTLTRVSAEVWESLFIMWDHF